MRNLFRRMMTMASVMLANSLFTLAVKIHARAVSVVSVAGHVTEPSGAVITSALPHCLLC